MLELLLHPMPRAIKDRKRADKKAMWLGERVGEGEVAVEVFNFLPIHFFHTLIREKLLFSRFTLSEEKMESELIQENVVVDEILKLNFDSLFFCEIPKQTLDL